MNQNVDFTKADAKLVVGKELSIIGIWLQTGVSIKPAKRRQNEANTVDTVCGMQTDPDIAAGKSEYKGQTYYFCAQAATDPLIRILRSL